MRKLLLFILIFAMSAYLFTPVAAQNSADQQLTLDPQLDSDGDGLLDVIEITYGGNINEPDTDADGVDDYTEFYVTHTDLAYHDSSLDSDSDSISNADEIYWGTDPGHIDTDGDRLDDYEEIFVYGTNPLLADTDNDGIFDSYEIKAKDSTSLDSAPNLHNSKAFPVAFDETSLSTRAVNLPVDFGDGTGGNTISMTLRRVIGYAFYPTELSYSLDFSYFFNDNKTYNPNLAVASSIISADAYDDIYLYPSQSHYTTTIETSLRDWMYFHGMTDYVNYDLWDLYNDHHVSEMYVARKEITQNGVTKNIICVVIRGTNGSLKEWQSNFDIGTTADFSSITGWTDSNNHQGFDITANRLNSCLNQYISTYASNKNIVLWITGHSRGGALANILAAKRIDAGDIVFAYTFASPMTTTYSAANSATKYSCIFNIVNTDDYVPKLPMSGWNFRRYGIDKLASINSNYKAEWNALTPFNTNYNCDEVGMDNVLSALTAIADNRNDCYEFRYDSAGYLCFYSETMLECQSLPNSIIGRYTSNMSGTYSYECLSENNQYKCLIYQKPVFLMQLLAAYQGGEIDWSTFLLIDVASYLEQAKRQIISASIGGMEDPHLVETYCLLATKLS